MAVFACIFISGEMKIHAIYTAYEIDYNKWLGLEKLKIKSFLISIKVK